jgi:alpha-1,2-mannosyltransferase
MILALGASRLLVLAAFVIFATFEAMFDSLRLGNVDALIVFSLALAFLALRRGRPWLIGVPLAGAAILKVSPAIVIGYFVYRREWRVLGGAVVGGAFFLALSLAVAGPENHLSFVRETLPRLSKGSTFYDNISIGGSLARAWFGPTSWYYEDEVPDWPRRLQAVSLLLTAGIVLGAYAVSRRDREAGFMLATAVAVLVAPISWSFYPTWLIPSLLFLVSRFSERRAWGRLALLAAIYPLLAIVPAHFSAIDEEIYRFPIKTAGLALYCALLAWEAQSSRTVETTRTGVDVTPAVAGARS